MGIGSRISACRMKAGLSQELLADKLNIPWDVVSHWEAGTEIPDTKEIVQLSQLLRISTDYLLLGDTAAKPKPKKPTYRWKGLSKHGASNMGRILLMTGLIGIVCTLIGAGSYVIKATNWFSVWGRFAIDALRMRLVVPLLLSLFVILVGVDTLWNGKK